MNTFNGVSVGLLAFAFALGSTGIAVAATTVNLGTAGSFAVLGGSTITNTGSSVINGDLGLSPGTSVTGFPPGVVNGTQHVTDAAAAQAEVDLVTAYNAASSQTGAVTVSGDLGGRTLTPGVYNSASSLGLTGALTLDAQGDPNAVFIFQVGSALTTASGSTITVINGAQACHVFWQVASSATLGTNSHFAGSVLALSSVTVATGASVDGTILARNGAVTLDTNSITKPTCVSASITPAATSTPVVVSTSTPVVISTSSPAVVPTVTPTQASTSTPTPVTTPVVTTPPTPTSTPAPTSAAAVPPNAPNTGAGGNAPETLFTLFLSAVVALGGITYLRLRMR